MNPEPKNKIPIEVFADVYHSCNKDQQEIMKTFKMTVDEFDNSMASLKEKGFHLTSEKRNFTIPDKEKLLLFIKEKLSNSEIAEQYNTTIYEVLRWYDIYKIKKPSFRRMVSNPAIETFYPIATLEDRKNTKAKISGILEWRSINDLAKQCGVSKQVMYKFVKKMGINSPGVSKTKDKMPPIETLYHLFINKGMTINKVASDHEVSWDQAKGWHDLIHEYDARLKLLK